MPYLAPSLHREFSIIILKLNVKKAADRPSLVYTETLLILKYHILITNESSFEHKENQDNRLTISGAVGDKSYETYSFMTLRYLILYTRYMVSIIQFTDDCVSVRSPKLIAYFHLVRPQVQTT